MYIKGRSFLYLTIIRLSIGIDLWSLRSNSIQWIQIVLNLYFKSFETLIWKKKKLLKHWFERKKTPQTLIWKKKTPQNSKKKHQVYLKSNWHYTPLALSPILKLFSNKNSYFLTKNTHFTLPQTRNGFLFYKYMKSNGVA